MFNPTLLAAVTMMLLLPNPKRLMPGYLLGAYTTSITLGLVIVFSLKDRPEPPAVRKGGQGGADHRTGGLEGLTAAAFTLDATNG